MPTESKKPEAVIANVTTQQGTLLGRMSGQNGLQIGSRIFAKLYDRVLAPSEEAGLSDRRARLLASAKGRVLELGAGTGLNLSHYPQSVESLALTEPDQQMALKLRSRAAAGVGEAFIEIVSAPAESLPFADSSFDAVVATLVLCTVKDPQVALAEVSRVLKPGGELLFIEHVRGVGSTARWQRLVARPWAAVAGGCRCDRTTEMSINGSPLDLVEIEHGYMPKAAPFIRPLIQGRAVRPAQ